MIAAWQAAKQVICFRFVSFKIRDTIPFQKVTKNKTSTAAATTIQFINIIIDDDNDKFESDVNRCGVICTKHHRTSKDEYSDTMSIFDRFKK